MNDVKRILLIAYYFPPSLAVGARRTLALYNALTKEGFAVDVFSANWDGVKIPKVQYIGCPVQQVNNSVKKVRRFVIGRYFRSLDSSILSSFFRNVVRDIIIKRDSFRGYDLVIVSYRPVCSILLGILISRVNSVKIIVELRDLISLCGHKKKIPLVDAFDRLLDSSIMRFVSRIVSVTPTTREKARDFYKRDVDLILNGIDLPIIEPGLKSVLSASEPHGNIVIFYSGNLSMTRRLDRVCGFIERYRGEKKIQIVVASAEDPIVYGGNNKIIDWVGYLSRHEVEAWQRKADYLLLIEGRTEDAIENIPAKVFEYLAAGRPILADCHPESDSVIILEETHTGCAIDTFEKFISAIETTWFDSHADLTVYQREYQNKKYLALIRAVLGNTTNGSGQSETREI